MLKIVEASVVFHGIASRRSPLRRGAGPSFVTIAAAAITAATSLQLFRSPAASTRRPPLIVRARFVGMGSTLEEASFDLGAAPLATFRQVTLPRLLPAILAGFLLSFTFSFDDYVLSQFTAGPSTETWPILVFAAVRFGITPKLNAFASVMLLVTLLALLLVGLILRRSRGTTGETESLAGGLGLG